MEKDVINVDNDVDISFHGHFYQSLKDSGLNKSLLFQAESLKNAAEYCTKNFLSVLKLISPPKLFNFCFEGFHNSRKWFKVHLHYFTSHLLQQFFNFHFFEASYFDWINMTKNGLEYDRKKFTPTNMKVGTWPKDYTDEP